MLVALIGLTAFSSGLMFNHFGASPGSYKEFVGWVGTPILGLGTLLYCGMILTSRSVVVVLTPSGITDTRFSEDEIPWIAVEEISTR